MLEFAKVPGLTKIFNRDDWQKVFMACRVLPDYRESKYSDYFITKDTAIRAGKLYYAKNPLEKGGYSFDPISHVQLSNEKLDGVAESKNYSFAPGERFEFRHFQVDVKKETIGGTAVKNITNDVVFAAGKNYYIVGVKTASRLTYIQLVIYSKVEDGAGNMKYFKLDWLSDAASYKEAKNLFTNKYVYDTGCTLYKKLSDGTWQALTDTSGPMKKPASDVSDENYAKWIAADTGADLVEPDGSINLWISIDSASSQYRSKSQYIKFAGDSTSIGKTVYDFDYIGSNGPLPGVSYLKRSLTGATQTDDEKFIAGKQYFMWNGKTLSSMVEVDADTKAADGEAYKTNNHFVAGDVISEAKDATTITVTDITSPRTYQFVSIDKFIADKGITKWTNACFTGSGMGTGYPAGNYIYRADTSTDLFTIDLNKGAASRVTYVPTGERICTSQILKHSDLKFRKNETYYVVKPGTLTLEPGFQILDPTTYTIGQTISIWEGDHKTEVYQFSNPFWVADTSKISSSTHGQLWYERAGINYPYEGFVAVTTEKSSEQAKGTLVTCKRKTYELTEDEIHGYTGDGSNAVSKKYYEYTRSTNSYAEVPTATKPMFRQVAGSALIDTTEDVEFQADKYYYRDIRATERLIEGTDYEVGERVDSKDFKVYDRHRTFYWRSIDSKTKEGTWQFNKVESKDTFGLTSDEHWITNGEGKLDDSIKRYFFYTGDGYTFNRIDQVYSVVEESIFGFQDMNDVYYGYNLCDEDLTSDGTYMTVNQYKATYGKSDSNVYGGVRRETISSTTGSSLGTTDLSGTTKMEPSSDPTVTYRYHIRNYATSGSKTASGGVHTSRYCVYDTMSKRIGDTNISYEASKLGTALPYNVYMQPDTMPQYFYMGNIDSRVWDNKFVPFGTPQLTEDTSAVAGKRYYKLDGTEYTRVNKDDPTLTNPQASGLYEYVPGDDYYGTLINAQQKIIYFDNNNGTVPTECLVYVKHDPETLDGQIPPEGGYLDGEEISDVPALYVESLLGEAILRDEYYEETYGRYVWETFFLDKGISASKVENVFSFMVDMDAVTGMAETPVMVAMTWTDPTIMIKKDEPTSTPDAWDRTSVILHYNDGTRDKSVVINQSRSHSEFASNPLIISTDDNFFTKMFLGKQALTEYVPTASEKDAFTRAMKNGYIELQAVSSTSRCSSYMFKVPEVDWDGGPDENYKFIDIFTGRMLETSKEDATYEYHAGFTSAGSPVSNVAIPGVKYYVDHNGKYELDDDVYAYITSTGISSTGANFWDNHVLKYDTTTPLYLVSVINYGNASGVNASYRNVVKVEPYVTGITSGVDDGKVIENPSAGSAGAIELHLCVFARTSPKISFNEIIRKGYAKLILDVGSVVTIPKLSVDVRAKRDTTNGPGSSDLAEQIDEPSAAGANITAANKALVIDMDHVRLARDYEVGYVSIDGTDDAAAAARGYLAGENNNFVSVYAPHAVSNFETTEESLLGYAASMAEILLPRPYKIDTDADSGFFYINNSDGKPHHQFYKRSVSVPSGSTPYDNVGNVDFRFDPIDYSASDWKDTVCDASSPVFYRISNVGSGVYIEYEDSSRSVTFRAGSKVGDSATTNKGVGYSSIKDSGNANPMSSTDTSFVAYPGWSTCILREYLNNRGKIASDTSSPLREYIAAPNLLKAIRTVINETDEALNTSKTERRISYDKFWIPSANQVGLETMTDPDGAIIPCPAEGGVLDWFYGNSINKKYDANRSWFGENRRKLGFAYWTRTMTKAVARTSGGTCNQCVIDVNGGPTSRVGTVDTAYALVMFTIG